jgi:hypothetical protein
MLSHKASRTDKRQGPLPQAQKKKLLDVPVYLVNRGRQYVSYLGWLLWINDNVPVDTTLRVLQLEILVLLLKFDDPAF